MSENNAENFLPPINTELFEWDEGLSTGDECSLCGREPRHEDPRHVYQVAFSPQDGLVYDYRFAATEEAEELEASFYPIGSSCAKKLPKGYVEGA